MSEAALQMANEANITYSGAADQPEPEPDVTRSVTGDYLFTWKTPNGEFLRVTCADLGFVKGELEARVTVSYKKYEGSKPRTLLSRKRWILESNSSTSSMYTELNRWKQSAFDWPSTLTWVSSWLQDNFESGDPLVWLDEVQDPGPLSYLVEPLIQHGEHTLVGARGGSLKSMTALALILSVVSGKTIIPGLHPRCEKPVKCLYLDYETNAATHKRRLLQIAKAKGIEIPQGMIAYKRMTSPFVHQKTELQRLIALQGIGLVVVDSVGRAVGGETVGEADVQSYYNACAAMGVTVLSIGHTSKSSADTVAGNAQWEFQARSMWIFEAAKEHGSNTVIVGMHHRKVNEGELLPSLNYAVSFGDGVVSYADADQEDLKQLKGTDLKAAIRGYLADNPNSTAKEIAEGLDNFNGTSERISNVLRQWSGNLWRSDGAKRNAKWMLLTPISNALGVAGGGNPYRVPPTPLANGGIRNEAVSNEATEEEPYWIKD